MAQSVRRRRKEARPAELLDAAFELFVERGFAATRIDDIAARAGVSKGTVYLYFPSKQAVFEALVRQAVLPNVERLIGETARPDTPVLEVLPRLLRAIMQTVAGSSLICSSPARIASRSASLSRPTAASMRACATEPAMS